MSDSTKSRDELLEAAYNKYHTDVNWSKPLCYVQVKEGFKAGADWQLEQYVNSLMRKLLVAGEEIEKLKAEKAKMLTFIKEVTHHVDILDTGDGYMEEYRSDLAEEADELLKEIEGECNE